ncbi:MAG: hypothetical protein IJL69_06275 [Oscillospiraceae bacterium]|nr:hypothetical protein [Oscillospiraceae bacterium]
MTEKKTDGRGPAATIAAVAARIGDKWLFFKKDGAAELPMAPCEAGESLCDAAGRQVCKDFGAEEFALDEVCDVSTRDETGKKVTVRLFFADLFGAVAPVERFLLSPAELAGLSAELFARAMRFVSPAPAL